MDVEAAKTALADFLTYNPQSSVVVEEDGATAIANPWGDDSIYLAIPDQDNRGLIDALNHIILPEQYTALWHRESKAFEIPYTAFPLVSD